MSVERVAIHEAGHAVAGYCLGRSLRRVSVSGPETGQTEFAFLRRDYCCLTSGGVGYRRERLTHAFAVQSLAGGAAELLAFGKVDLAGMSRDFDAAIVAGAWMDADSEATANRMEFAFAYTLAFLRLPPRWQAVEALAAELAAKREVSGHRASCIIQSAIG